MAAKVMIIGYDGDFLNPDECNSNELYSEVFDTEDQARTALATYHKDLDEKLNVFRDFRLTHLRSIIAIRGERDDGWSIVFSQTSPK